MDIQKLQRAIVDGLEDVKAQNIEVFNTEHLTALFERVVVASGTSNRQTRALAASVRDAVKQEGLPVPRMEGEENGEWIIIDCGAAVVHVMQPTIREYYHLEELWGEKPVVLTKKVTVKKVATKKTAVKATTTKKVAAKKTTAAKTSTIKTPAKAPAKTVAKKTTVAKKVAPTKITPVKKVAAKKAASTTNRITRTVGVKRTPALKSTVKKTAKIH
jgi:ribosome-associated protein